MTWIQIAALVGVALFALVKFGAFKYMKPKNKTVEPLQYTLQQCAPMCEAIEDFKAWKRLVDLVGKDESN
jgi:hypothetical protein